MAKASIDFEYQGRRMTGVVDVDEADLEFWEARAKTKLLSGGRLAVRQTPVEVPGDEIPPKEPEKDKDTEKKEERVEPQNITELPLEQPKKSKKTK